VTPVDDLGPESSSEPFWHRMNVGRLMAIVVPVAIYCAMFAASEQPDPSQPRSSTWRAVDHWPLAVAPVVLAISGIIVSVRRRATFRSAVLQWCVPPAFFVTLWTMLLVVPPSVMVFLACLGVGLSLGTALNRFWIWYGEKEVPWPNHWVADSVLWGFAHLGIMLVTMFPLWCCVLGYYA